MRVFCVKSIRKLIEAGLCLSDRRRDAMIEVEQVSKDYEVGKKPVNALKSVSLKIEKGEFCAVMGPSGSGKSTLLHVIGGLITPTKGRVIVDGRDIGKLSDDELTLYRRRHVGFVFQFFNLLPTLSARENVAMPLLLDGKRMDKVAAKVDDLLKLVGLYDRASHKPDELSGGEMQRVAIARALVTDPKVILADEPTGNLDSKTGAEILGMLKDACEKLGNTVILVTHDENAASYAKRIINIRDGEIVSDRKK